MKKQEGITLIALVITIIVLLILAAVTIAALGGSNGILTNASRSTITNELGEAKDLVSLAVSEGVNDYYTDIYVTGTPETDGVNDKITVIKTKLQELITPEQEDILPETGVMKSNGKTKLTVIEDGDGLQITIQSENGRGKSKTTVNSEGTLQSWNDEIE